MEAQGISDDAFLDLMLSKLPDRFLLTTTLITITVQRGDKITLGEAEEMLRTAAERMARKAQPGLNGGGGMLHAPHQPPNGTNTPSHLLPSTSLGYSAGGNHGGGYQLPVTAAASAALTYSSPAPAISDTSVAMVVAVADAAARAQGAIRTESARQAAATCQTRTSSSSQACAPSWAPARWCT
jgi:hypothetical protein